MSKHKLPEQKDLRSLLKKVKKIEDKLLSKLTQAEKDALLTEDNVDMDESEYFAESDSLMEPENPDAISCIEEHTLQLTERSQNNPDQEELLEQEIPLDPEILELLGEDPANNNEQGEYLHKDLASRWIHILLNGMNKDARIDLLKKYLPPENCKNVKAPKLNPEIKAALSDINLKKDAYSEGKQNQLGSCLAALGKALKIAIDKHTSDAPELVKALSDASRLLCDYHHKESLTRRYAITNTMVKENRDILKNTKIDEYLFGSSLLEHMKSSKAIMKSGAELKPPPPPRPAYKPANNTQAQQSHASLNLKGGQRTSSTRPSQNPTRRPPRAPAPPVSRERPESTKTQNKYPPQRRR